jgi:hypothetical protein
VAEGRDLTLHVRGVAALYSLRKCLPGVKDLLRAFSRQTAFTLWVDAGWLGKLRVSPRPSPLVRLFLPRA